MKRPLPMSLTLSRGPFKITSVSSIYLIFLNQFPVHFFCRLFLLRRSDLMGRKSKLSFLFDTRTLSGLTRREKGELT